MVDYLNTFVKFYDDGRGSGNTRNGRLYFYKNRQTITGGRLPTGRAGSLRLYDSYTNPSVRQLLATIPVSRSRVTSQVPEIWINIQLNQIRLLNKFNEADFVQNNEVVDKMTINDFDVVVINSQSNYESIDPIQIFRDSTASIMLNQADNDTFTFSGRANYNSDLSTLYAVSFTNVTFTDPTDLPITMPVLSTLLSYEGTIDDPDNIEAEIQIDRFGNNFPSFRLDVDGTNDIPLPPNPNPEPEPNNVLTLSNLEATESEFLQADWNTNPTINPNDIQSLTTFIQKLLPESGSILTRVFGTNPPDRITFNSVEEGSQYRIWVVIQTKDNRTIRSPEYSFTYSGQEIIPEVDNFHEFTIEQTKVFILNVSMTVLEIRLINELFNSTDVSNVIVSVTKGETPQITTVDNNGLGSEIDVFISALDPDSVYAVRIFATYREKEIPIGVFNIHTTKLLPTNPTPEELQKDAEDKLIRRSYDYEDSELIEVLSDAERAQIVCGILSQQNVSDTVQLIHDFNKKNRKGSIYNRGESEAVKTQYIKSLEERLTEAVQFVPDIDEGYRL